jgi:hypothetical protein
MEQRLRHTKINSFSHARKVLDFYGTRRLISAFRKVHHWLLSWSNSIGTPFSTYSSDSYFSIMLSSRPRSYMCYSIFSFSNSYFYTFPTSPMGVKHYILIQLIALELLHEKLNYTFYYNYYVLRHYSSSRLCLKCPVYISKQNVSETGVYLRPQVKPTQLGPIYNIQAFWLSDVHF